MSQVLFRLSVQRLLERKGAARRAEIFREAGCDVSPIEHPISLGPKSVNSRAAREALQRWAPEAVILHGTRIVGKRTLRCVDVPWINIHAGVTPTYRGVHGGWWALAEQRPEAFGATVHLVDEGIDTGGILRQPRVMPSPEDHFGTYPTLQFCVALEALLELLEEGPPFVASPAVEPEHKLRYHPTLGQYVRSRWMFGVR
ncbi:MAG TPA: formyl transferase [Polyangiaceae bacterium]|nr:formyl transferase [Polyangiaceae bacterium]